MTHIGNATARPAGASPRATCTCAREVLHDHAVGCVEQADDLAPDVREHAVAVPAEILVKGRQALWRVVAHAVEAEMAVLREASDDGGHVTGHLGTEMLEERGIEKPAAFQSHYVRRLDLGPSTSPLSTAADPSGAPPKVRVAPRESIAAGA